jgi:hypothetical protein
VIASANQGAGQPLKNGLAIVENGRLLAMYRHLGASYDAIIDMANTLVPQTDPQDWDSSPEAPDDIVGDTGL